MTKLEKIENDIKAIMDFMRKHLVTRADLAVVEKKLDHTIERVDNLTNSVDALTKASIRDRQENKIRGHRIDRIEAWVEVAAPKIDVPYET